MKSSRLRKFDEMPKKRLTYFFLVVATIVIGILSRHINGIPLFIGDVLWGLMVYFIVRFLFFSKKLKWAAVASLLFSYAIEVSQLYQAQWINSIRHTIIGGLILGFSFEWSDMLCYTAGIGIGILIDVKLTKSSRLRKF